MCTVWAALFLFLSPFPFRYRFAALLRTPSPLTHPSLLSVCPFPRLSTTFPFSSSSPALASPSPAILRSSFPTLRLRLSFSCSPRPLSLVISSSFARSRFFSRFFYRPPPIFPLPYACLLSFFRSPTITDSSLLTPSPLAVPSSSLSSLSTYPRRLRRDGPIFSSRFLGSDIFYTFFLPSFSDGCPCARSPSPPSEYRLEHPFRLPLSRVAHTHMLSLPFVSSILRPFSPLIRPPLASLSPLFHFSLPFTPAFVSLSFAPPFHPCGSYRFDFFFTATRPPTDAARRRPFSIGTLFSTIGSTTYSRTHVRSQLARERETER